VGRYERRTLIYDPDGAGLARAALALVERGLDPLYARDPDEILLLARQDRARIGALMLPGALPVEHVDRVLARIAPILPAERAAVIAVAPARDRASRRALAERGVGWAVWDAEDVDDLRFAVSAALASYDALDPRSGLRVPVHLEAVVEVDRAPRRATVRNLSLGGAYLALGDPPAAAAEIACEISLAERLLRVRARVAHRAADGGARRAEPHPGCGVAFQSPSDADRRLLEEFIRERIGSFRL
jgi:hypothetical protein